MSPRDMRPPPPEPPPERSVQEPLSGFNIGIGPLLLIVLCLAILAACSSKPLPRPTLTLPANLAANCPGLPTPPEPLIDHDRAIWEATLIARYADCALRHRMTVEAWPRKRG